MNPKIAFKSFCHSIQKEDNGKWGSTTPLEDAQDFINEIGVDRVFEICTYNKCIIVWYFKEKEND